MSLKKLFEKGYDKQSQNLYLEAIEEYNKVLKIDEKFERAYVQRAYCKAQLRDYLSAIEDYKIALSINPDDAITYLNLGVANYYSGDKNNTLYFDKAIEIDPKNMAEAYFMKGLVLINNDLYPEAINELSKAIEIKSDWAAFYFSRVTCYSNINEFQKAIDDYTRAGQLDFSRSKIDENIAYCKEEMKKLLAVK